MEPELNAYFNAQMEMIEDKLNQFKEKKEIEE